MYSNAPHSQNTRCSLFILEHYKEDPIQVVILYILTRIYSIPREGLGEYVTYGAQIVPAMPRIVGAVVPNKYAI